MRSLTTTKTKSIQEKQDSNHTDVQHSSKKLVSTKPVTERQDPNCPEALCLAKKYPQKAFAHHNSITSKRPSGTQKGNPTRKEERKGMPRVLGKRKKPLGSENGFIIFFFYPGK